MPVTVTGATVTFGTRAVLKGLDAHMPGSSVTAIMAPSGAGKSTLLAVIAGQQALDSGSVDRHGVSPDRVGFVFQSAPLVLDRRARDNVALGGLARGLGYSEASNLADELLAELGMTGLAQQPAHRLSGGERQRVAILQTMALGAPILLADEPTAALDKANRREIVRSLRAAADRGATVIVATHDDSVAEACDHVLRLWD